MQILVTGSGTLLGNSLAIYLSKKNIKLICTYKNSFPKNLSKYDNIKLVQFDLNKRKNLGYFDVLIHCASAIPNYSFSKSKLFETNVNGFKNLLELCKKNNCKKIIMISTMSVYGKITTKRVTENYIGKNVDDYGKTKKKMEDLLYQYYLKNIVSATILRLPGILGKQSKYNFLSLLLLKMKNKNKNEIILSNPDLKFNNAVHVQNLCEIVFASLKNKKFNIFNLASKYPLKLKNIVKKMAENVNFDKKLIVFKKNNNKGFNIDNKKAQRIYNLYSTRKTIKKFLNDNSIN